MLLLMIFGCVSTEYSRNNVLSAWAYHGVAALEWNAKNGISKPFACEVYAREAVALLWRDMKIKDPKLQDKNLDELLAVRDQSYMEEYVWIYLSKSDWKEPAGLELEAFQKWRETAVSKEHNPDFTLLITEEGKEKR